MQKMYKKGINDMTKFDYLALGAFAVKAIWVIYLVVMAIYT